MFFLELRFSYHDRCAIDQFAKESRLPFSRTEIMDEDGKLTGRLELPDQTLVYEPLYPTIEYFKLQSGGIFIIADGDIPQWISEEEICRQMKVERLNQLEWILVKEWQRGQMERLRFIAEAGL